MSNTRDNVLDLCNQYIEFLNYCRTERDVSEFAARYVESLSKFVGPRKTVMVKQRGGRGLVAVFRNNAKSVRIIGAHVDSPRIDIKANPLHEKDGHAYLDTHYYGGIKKYQWVATPLGMAGVVCTCNSKEGDCSNPVMRTVNVRYGLPVSPEWQCNHKFTAKSDNVFCITDLLPHLADEYMNKPASKVVDGENMDIMAALPEPRPESDDGKTENPAVKRAVELLVKDGVIQSEKDFVSAELSLVPAFEPRLVGLDGEIIGGYGQDDRSCAYAALSAFGDYVLNASADQPSAVLILTDKEEIGSEGVTGAQCDWFYTTAVELLGIDRMPDDTTMISADVTAAYDPMYGDAYCEHTSARLGGGVAINKYTGYGGKYDASDASPEFVAAIRWLLDERNVNYQVDEMGRVDNGGGGTIAMYYARRGIDVLDIGIPVLNMHSPFELIAERDLQAAYDAYNAFFGMPAIEGIR